MKCHKKEKMQKFERKLKHLMKHARECVAHIKGNITDIRKINAVRKKKGVHLTHDVLGTCGGKLKNCGRNDLESSSISWVLN